MKFLIQLGFIFSLILCLTDDVSAQMYCPSTTGYVQSEDIIKYALLDASCTKNDPNQMELNFTGEIKTTREDYNLFKLDISPIRLSTPDRSKLIKCQVSLFIYIEPKIYLRFLVAGSDSPMTLDEIKSMVENPNALSETLSRRLNHAKLIRAKVPQGFIMQFPD